MYLLTALQLWAQGKIFGLAFLKRQLQTLQKQITVAQEPSKNGGLEQINKALGYIKSKDMIPLKSIYKQLFKKIVVRPLNKAKVELEFIFNNMSTSLRMGEVKFCASAGLMELSSHCAESVLNLQFSMVSSCSTTSLFIPENVLKQKYLEDRLSIRDIAHAFACSKTHVRDLLLKHNIPLRQPHKRYNRWYTYGKRRIGSNTIDHKGELRTIATIKQMYGEGMNTSAITRCLNAMKLPTKQQGKGWHQNTVAKILKREGVYVEGRRTRGSAPNYSLRQPTATTNLSSL